jgi:hypothetical protein
LYRYVPEAFPEATKQRQRVEHQIELSHINSLENNCLFERQQQQRMYRFGTKSERWGAVQLEVKTWFQSLLSHSTCT